MLQPGPSTAPKLVQGPHGQPRLEQKETGLRDTSTHTKAQEKKEGASPELKYGSPEQWLDGSGGGSRWGCLGQLRPLSS